MKPAPQNWEGLRAKTKEKLLLMGFGNWDGRLMLFHKDWHGLIPEGLLVETIMGEEKPFEAIKADNDSRMGFLAYGIPAVDGVKDVPE